MSKQAINIDLAALTTASPRKWAGVVGYGLRTELAERVRDVAEADRDARVVHRQHLHVAAAHHHTING